jgi:hypothetical protein
LRDELEGWRDKLSQCEDKHTRVLLKHKVDGLEPKVDDALQRVVDVRSEMATRIVAAEQLGAAESVRRLEELATDPDGHLAFLDDTLRRLADSDGPRGRHVERRGRRKLEDDPVVLEDYLERARKAEDIKRQHPRMPWADIAAMPEIDTTERRLREWRQWLKSGGKRRG